MLVIFESKYSSIMANKNKKKQNRKGLKSSPSANLSSNSFFKDSSRFYPILGVLLITFIAFIPTLSAGFVNWDDNVNLLENPNLIVFNWDSIVGIFSSNVIGNYNPLPIFTFAIEKAIFGLNPKVFHLNNLLLHLVCTFFVYRIMLQLKLSPFAAAFAALLFGIHPMRVESVAWVTERKDVLFGTFYLPALWLYIKSIKQKNGQTTKQLITILILFILALFSKIQAVALPLSMLAVDYYFHRPLKVNLILEKASYFILSLLFGLLGVFILGSEGSLDDAANFTFIDRLFIGAYSYLVYLYKLIIPYPLSGLYPYPSSLNWIFYLSPLPLLVLLFGLFKAFQKGYRSIVFGFTFFTFNVMFLLQILGAGQGFLADRFTYIPYIGFFFLAGFAYQFFTSKNPSTKGTWHIIMGGYALILLSTTFSQTKVWTNSNTLWTQTIKHFPKAHTAYSNRGHFFRDNGNFSEAIKNYNEAIRVNPKKAETYNSRGKLYFENQQVDKAIQDYTTGIQMDPTIAELYANRGGAYGASGKIDLAVQDLNKSIELDPEFKNAYLNRSIAYFQRGQFDLAIQDYTAYLKLAPYNADIWYERGLAYYNLKQYPKALKDLNQAISLNNNKGLYFLIRSQTHNQLGQRGAALQDAQMAQRLGTQVNEDYINNLK